MNCDDVKELLALSPAEVSAGEAASHVAGCGACRESVRTMAHLRAALGEVPSGYPREATLDAIRRAARAAALEGAVVSGAARAPSAAARAQSTTGSFWAWILGPAMRPALGFAAVGAVALAVVLSTGTGERSGRDDTAGPPGRVASRAESAQPRAEAIAAASPEAEKSGPRRVLVLTSPEVSRPSQLPSGPSPGGLSAAPVADARRDEGAKAMRQAVAVVTPSTKDVAERDQVKKSVLGALKASSGESIAGLVKAESESALAGAVAKSPEPRKDVDTSRADRIGIREGARESLAGQQIARKTETAPRAAGAGTGGGGGAGSLGAAMAPGRGGYEEATSMRAYGGKAAYKSMKAERVSSAPVANAAPSMAARAKSAPPAPPAPTANAKEQKGADTATQSADANQRAALPVAADDAQRAAQRAVNARNYVAAQRILVPRYGKTPREPQVALLLAETHVALKQWKEAALVLEPLLDRITEGPHVDRVLGLLEKVYEAEKADEKLKAVRAKRSSRSR